MLSLSKHLVAGTLLTMKRVLTFGFVMVSSILGVRAETESIDLKELAKKARPAVMLLVVSDATGKELATGTGFLISPDGKLITNHHVIQNASAVVAKAENGGAFTVEGVLVDDPKNDVVLLKLKGKDLPFLPVGNSDKIEVGTRIAIIGSPLGLEGTLSDGIVSAVRESLGDVKVLQVTAALSPGSSGSPVLNAKGEVIGVARAFLREGQALNFAVPIGVVNQLLSDRGASATLKTLSDFSKEVERERESDADYKAFSNAHATGDYVEALKRAKVLVRRYPNSARTWNDLGGTYYMLQFWDDAVESFQHAIKLDPDYEPSWACLGTTYLAVHKYAEAIAACQQAIKLKPDSAVAWRDLGNAYDEIGRKDEARDAFRRAKELKPELFR
jgi:Flp pilus assembly protein TadD